MPDQDETPDADAAQSQGQALLRPATRTLRGTARARHVALLARDATADLEGLSERALDHLWEQLLNVPLIDLSLLVSLPKLIGPDLKRLQEAISRDDPTGAGTPSPPSQNRSTHPNSEPSSPTRSSVYATNTASTADKPPPHS